MSLLRTERIGRVALLTLDDPKRRNVLSAPLCKAISAAIADANSDPDVHSIVITGSPPSFCAGAELSDLRAAAQGDTVALEAVYRSFMDVAQCPLPTIAAINGAAVGAGLNLALACDIRVASTGALFDTRFLKIGLHPGGGHTWMLLRAVGWAQAARLLLAGAEIGAGEAREIGLAQSVVSPELLRTAALELAGAMDGTPRELLLRTKQSLRHAVTADHQSAFTRETTEQLWSLKQPAFAELVARLESRISRK